MQQTDSPERIPREALHAQHERLTSKHIQTLSFLQDIGNENKQLKVRIEQLEEIQKEYESLQQMTDNSQDRIKQIQEQYLRRADEINAMLAEKHKTEIMQLVEEKLEIEKAAFAESCKLKEEIESLEQTNRQLADQLSKTSDSEDDRKSLLQDLQDARQENKDLKEEIARIQEVSDSKADMHHVQGLKAQNEALNHQLKELTQKKDELEHRISRLESELREKTLDMEKVTLIDNLKIKLEKLHREKTENVQRLSENGVEIHNLKQENEQLQGALIKVEKEKENLAMEFKNVFYELHTLRKRFLRTKENQTFKEFVTVKRELNMLKDENQVLRNRTKLTVEKLPFLKADKPSLDSKPSGKDSSSAKKSEKRDSAKTTTLALPSSLQGSD